jgi:hypothetical protein
MSEFWPLIFTAVALCSSLLGLWKSMHKQAFSETPQLAVFGIFVWGDAR